MKRLLYILSFLFSIVGFNKSAAGQKSIDSVPKIDCEKVFAFASEMPKYPGGGKAAITDMNAVVKRVACQAPTAKYLLFVVTAEGKVKSPMFMPGNLKACAMVLEREFETLPLWSPAKQAGKPVCVNFTIPLK